MVSLRFGRDIIADLRARESEWLVTNGIGGYASGTISGIPTRGYHGILVAALKPPVDRRVCVPALVEVLHVEGREIALSGLRWSDGSIAPDPSPSLLTFRLEGLLPIWRYDCAGVVFEKCLWMDHGANVTRVQYHLLSASGPATLSVGVLSDARDYHGRSFSSDWRPDISTGDGFLQVRTGDVDLFARMPGAHVAVDGSWWRGFDLAKERERGLTDREDHIHAAVLTRDLAVGEPVQLTLSVGQDAAISADALAEERQRQTDLLKLADMDDAPDWVRHLALAADQFVVRRYLHDGAPAHTVIAGYHWFADWGRDTMISLPGLTLVTGRPEIARSILSAFADVIDGGMIPNRFPDAGTEPEFNTVDATFWFVEAIAAVHRTAPDAAFLTQIYPVVCSIVDHLAQGTRYGIRIDPTDGLIHAGEEGVQLTWMDARVGDRVVTPRIGKPIEVNALWISNLRFIIAAGESLGRDVAAFRDHLAKALTGFARFWNEQTGFCYDVLDGPAGHEGKLRPNQIFAARAATGALTGEQCRRVIAACERELLTPCGLRSLSPADPDYIPRYGGDQQARDGAYHQGTVWAWLIGAFVEAHLDHFGDRSRALEILTPLGDQLRIEGLGSIGEIFEARAPYAPRGCIAQAWSVAETLRAWALIANHKVAAAPD
ncbi:amylo-alpha-1,6-glucosidase [Rhizobium sp. FKL33]|uniref:amylo-alpha-1,6-glucosidase n=1 Tax=Rhizobium sp. FKL33 TaxID=2562307 RepID=UPI0019803A3B|nr:amylo-alpha-1,6-glucosidase [Rhizobium sp. FKL33]